MVREIIIAPSRKSEIENAIGGMRDTLLRRFCAQLEKAYRDKTKDRIIVIGAGSDYDKVDSKADMDPVFLKNNLEECPVIDPLKYASQMKCTWALEELKRIGDNPPCSHPDD